MSPNYRSRLEGSEFELNDRPCLFAATPLTETLKLLLSRLARAGKSMTLLHADGSRAYCFTPRWFARASIGAHLTTLDRASGNCAGAHGYPFVGLEMLRRLGIRDAPILSYSQATSVDVRTTTEFAVAGRESDC